jgi:preprotein translocase subunit SecA
MVIGTDRHESRRIDRQLRGRCARQGDPGASRFYVSFEDDLMRNFGASDRMTKIMERFGLEDGQELEHPWLDKSVENAQKRVEQRNYQIRKRTLEFDDVMNKQREVVYGLRQDTIDTEKPRETINEVIQEAIPMKVDEYLKSDDGEEPNYKALLNWVNMTFPLGLSPEKAAFETRTIEDNGKFLVETVTAAYDRKTGHEEPDAVRGLERYIILNAVDRLWQEHLYAMDALREGVYLRSIGQKDPLVEYKNEAYDMFVELMRQMKFEILNNLFRSTSNLRAFEEFLASLPHHLLAPSAPEEASADYTPTIGTGAAGGALPRRPVAPTSTRNVTYSGGGADGDGATEEAQIVLPVRREMPKVGRNEPCPCGSGKKYKACHGRGLV